MFQPSKRSPSPPPFPNTSQSLQQGNASLNYPAPDQGPNDFPEHQAPGADLNFEDSEWDLFFSGEDWSNPINSSQTSHTDPSQEAYPQTTDPSQSQDVPIDPLLSSNTLGPPISQPLAESVSDLGFLTQTEPRQDGFPKPPNACASSRSSLARSAKRSVPPTNKLSLVTKTKDRQRCLGSNITGQKWCIITPAISKDVVIEGHRPKRRRLSTENAQLGIVTNDPDVSQRAASFLRHWISETPDRGPTRKEIASLADLTECSLRGIENWFKKNGNLPKAPQFDSGDHEYPPNIMGNPQQDPENTCKSSPSEPLSWRRPREPGMPYSCTHRCGRNFNKRGGWERHERINWGQKVWKCPRCPKTFKRRDKLGTDRGHLKTVHKIEPTVEIMQNACQSNEESFRERCGFCGSGLRGWKAYINHVGGHFADETMEPRWHMSMWRRPWIDSSGSKPPGGDNDNDDNNDDDGNGGNDHAGYDGHQNGGRDTSKSYNRGGQDRPSSRGGSSYSYRKNGPQPNHTNGRQCHLRSNSTDAFKDGDLSCRDYHRTQIAPVSNMTSRCSFEAFQQLLMQRSMLRKKSIGTFLDFYDPFERTLCSSEFVGSHWMEQLEQFIEDMQCILPNELLTHDDSQLELRNPVWRPIMPPVSIEIIFLASWLPFYGDLHITIMMMVSLVWTKIAGLHMSRSLWGYRPYTVEHISDPLWPSPLEICKSPFAKFSNHFQLASSSNQSFGGLSDFSDEDLANSMSSNGTSNGLPIHGQFVASNSVGTALSLLNYGDAKGTELVALCWLYVLLIDLPRRMPNVEEIKFLVLLRRAPDHTIMPWIQEKVSPAISTPSQRTNFPTATIASRPGNSPGIDVTCIATRSSACLPWNKARNPTRPYSCTKKCGWSFRKKSDWVKHEIINLNREKWTCVHCQLCVARWTDFRDHLNHVHQQPANSPGSENSRSHPTANFFEWCGFCGHRCGSWKHWTNHVGAHFENRIKGGPWVMSRWIHPWVDKDNALHDDLGSYEDYDRNGDNDDDHGNGDSGNGDDKGGGSGAAGSCSNLEQSDSESNSGSKSASRRRETHYPEANQVFSPRPQPPKTSAHLIRTGLDLSVPLFFTAGNPPRSNYFNQQSAAQATWPLTADRSSRDNSIAASPPNPIIKGVELCDEPDGMLLPDPTDTPLLEAVSTTMTSSTSEKRLSKRSHLATSKSLSYLTPPRDQSDPNSSPFIHTLYPSLLGYRSHGRTKEFGRSIYYSGYRSADSLLKDNELSFFCLDRRCKQISAFSGKGCLIR